MREIRQSGSEGGVGRKPYPYPYQRSLGRQPVEVRQWAHSCKEV